MPNPHREFEEARRLLVRGVAEIKGGENKTARRYLERMLNVPATRDQKADAYYWLSEIADTDAEKRDFLLSALGYDLAHHRARRSLAILDKRLDESEIIDPDRYVPDRIGEPQRRAGKRFECPTCGSRMVYSADGNSLNCEHCTNRVNIEQSDSIHEEEFVVGISTAKGHHTTKATQAFDCESCGAVYILPPEVLSLTCPHCDSVYAILQPQLREMILPEGIIPFEINEKAAEGAVIHWGESFGDVSGKFRLETLTGIYLPCWTFDVAGIIKWTGYIEYQDSQTVSVNDRATIYYDDVFVPGSKPEPRYFRELLKEFRSADIQPFDTKFTANFLAESYQISMSDAAIDARALAYRTAKRDQKEKSGLRKVQSLQFYSDEIYLESYKLVLVPVWMGGMTSNGKRFEVLVNGKSGKVYMDPLSKDFRQWINKLFNR